jgi:hypothetical protein
MSSSVSKETENIISDTQSNQINTISIPDVVLPIQQIKEQCNFNTTAYEPSHPCNQFILRQEAKERQILENTADNNDLYPIMDDPNFSLKIANKREFHDTVYDGTIYNVEERANELGNMDFELSPHQLFVKNFLSSHTPYNSLLLFHGLGTGKTCSAIGICEEHRDYIRQTGNPKKIIVVASPNVQDNFRLQLFNEATMKSVNGEWTIKSCIGNKLIQEINPTKTLNVSKERSILQINRIINESYEFMGYREFANYIDKKQRIGLYSDEPITSAKNIARMKRNIKEEFEGRLLCIDEVHNIRNADDSDNKIVANQLMFLIKSKAHMKLLLLSGTPMFNSYKEIIWITNLMNMNDGRGLIKVNDVFDADGYFQKGGKTTENGRELLIRKLTGYVSFVRGENPYTFPYRMYSNYFSPEHTFQVLPQQTKGIIGGNIASDTSPITNTNVYVVKTGEYQEEIYNQLTNEMVSLVDKIDEKHDDADADILGADGTARIGYTRLQDPIQSLNMTFPFNSLLEDSSNMDIDTMVKDGKFVLKDTIGSRGLKATMDYIDERTENNYMKGEFVYKPWVQKGEHSNFFSPEKIGKYSGKIKQICDCVIKSTGVVLIYSQYLDGGLIPMALALESLGITRYGSSSKSLFKTPPTTPLRLGTKNMPAKYILITGDKRISPGNADEIIEVTKDNNLYGDYIKVVLVSMAGSEGVDLKFIRQVHILEPWFNRSRIEQIEGRAVRHNSHKLLPFRERNVQVFLYGSSVRDEKLETVDIYVYRNAEFKALQIGRVTRVLKELSVDCFLNHSQTNFSVTNMNQEIEQVLSSGKVVPNFNVGDKPNTMLTDFMEDGQYKCYSHTEANDAILNQLNNSTYGERFIMLNTDKIIQNIRGLFKEKHFYKMSDLLSRLKHSREYPIAQIYAALTIMIDTDAEYIIDAYGRTGKLVNIGEYYLFQPIELENKHITLFERSAPIPYKHSKLNIKMNINTSIDDEQLRAMSDVSSVIKRPDVDSELKTDNLRINVNDSINLSTHITSSQAPQNNGDEFISQIQNMYNDSITGYNTKNGIPRGSTDIYKYFGTAMSRLVNNKIIPSEEDVMGFFMDHIMETTPLGHKIILLHYVYSNDMTEPNLQIKERIKTWFNKQLIHVDGDFKFTAIMFHNAKSKKEDRRIVYIRSNIPNESELYKWTLAQPEDIKDLQKYIDDNYILTPDDLSNLFGFNGDDIKNDNIIFKLKDAENKRSKGHRCSEMKKDGKIEILRKLIPSDIIEKLKYVSFNKQGIPTTSYHVMQEACVFIEFILRHYNSIKKDGKRWFFSYNEHHMFRDVLGV